MLRITRIGLAATLAAVVVAAPLAAAGQAPATGGGRGQGPGGMRGGPGRQGGGSLATAPVSALKLELNLSDAQVEKITALQQTFQQQMQQMRPQFGGRGGPGGPPPGGPGGPPPGGPGGPSGPPPGGPGGPGPGGFGGNRGGANFAALTAARQAADTAIKAELTSDQIKLLPLALKVIDSSRMVGIPPEAMAELQLSGDQMRSIATLADGLRTAMPAPGAPGQAGQPAADPAAMFAQMRAQRDAAHTKALAILNPTQVQALNAYIAAHPNTRGTRGGGFGRRGGRGGAGGPGGQAPPPPADPAASGGTAAQ